MVTQLKRPLKVEVKMTEQKGWGCFATSPIFEGEIIEECPLLFIPKEIYKHIPDFLIDYTFGFPETDPQSQPVVPFGFGCLYNHSNTPNAGWKHHPEDPKIFQFIARNNIKAGEEICTYYGGEEYWAQRPYVKLV